jgi:hypothetical protein
LLFDRPRGAASELCLAISPIAVKRAGSIPTSWLDCGEKIQFNEYPVTLAVSPKKTDHPALAMTKMFIHLFRNAGTLKQLNAFTEIVAGRCSLIDHTAVRHLNKWNIPPTEADVPTWKWNSKLKSSWIIHGLFPTRD